VVGANQGPPIGQKRGWVRGLACRGRRARASAQGAVVAEPLWAQYVKWLCIEQHIFVEVCPGDWT
jgi:hypothetical protein